MLHGARALLSLFPCTDRALAQSSLYSYIGTVIGSSVQAGLYSAAGDISNWKGSQYGFYFLIAWLAVAFLLVSCIVSGKDAEKDDDETEVE